MNLLDRAIEQYKGVWPEFDWESHERNENALVLVKHLDPNWNPEGVSIGDIVLGGTKADPYYAEVICTKEQFEKRARELYIAKAEQVKEALPQAGIECEFRVKPATDKEFSKCFFVGLNSRGSFVLEVMGRYYTYVADQVEFRPIKSEREKFVDSIWHSIYKAANITELGAKELAGQLYDAGFRGPNENTNSASF